MSKYHPQSKPSACRPLAPSVTATPCQLPPGGSYGVRTFPHWLVLWESTCCRIPQSKIKDFCQLPQAGSLWVRYRYRAGQGSNESQKVAVRIVSGDSPQLPTVGSYGRVDIRKKEEKPRFLGVFLLLFRFLLSYQPLNRGSQVRLAPRRLNTCSSTSERITEEWISQPRSLSSCSMAASARGSVVAQIDRAMSTSSV